MGSSAKNSIVDNESERHLIGRWNGALLCDLLAYLIKLIVDQLPLKKTAKSARSGMCMVAEVASAKGHALTTLLLMILV